MLASIAAAIPRDKWVPFALYRWADILENFIGRTKRHIPPNGRFTDREWRKIAAQYDEDYRRLASALAGEACGWTRKELSFARLVKKPQSLEDMEEIVTGLNRLADDAPKWRTRRLIFAAFQGYAFGYFAWLILHFVATRML